MRYRILGRTGLYVSELCLGTMTFGGKSFWEVIGKLGATEAESLVGTALDAGVNFIDTADVYSDGESEKLLGAALASLARPREQVVVATKVRGRMGPGPNQTGLSRAHILASIDASLKRLNLDHVDLYQIHGVDLDTPIEETVRALDDVVRSGKVRYVGFSNHPAWQAMKAIGFADAHGLARFQSAQVYYSIAGRDIEREVVPMAKDQGVAILPWSPLAGGLLSGKFDGQAGPRGGAADEVRLPSRRPRSFAEGALGAARSVAGERRVGRARRAGVDAHASFRHERHPGGEDARAARRQPRRGGPEARARARREARRGERAPAGVPGVDGRLAEPGAARAGEELSGL
jgi:aryl-alcohol dehydrogenase-like predicted oxidoreductase